MEVVQLMHGEKWYYQHNVGHSSISGVIEALKHLCVDYSQHTNRDDIIASHHVNCQPTLRS